MTVKMIGRRSERWPDSRYDWPRALEFDLSVTHSERRLLPPGRGRVPIGAFATGTVTVSTAPARRRPPVPEAIRRPATPPRQAALQTGGEPRQLGLSVRRLPERAEHHGGRLYRGQPSALHVTRHHADYAVTRRPARKTPARGRSAAFGHVRANQPHIAAGGAAIRDLQVRSRPHRRPPGTAAGDLAARRPRKDTAYIVDRTPLYEPHGGQAQGLTGVK